MIIKLIETPLINIAWLVNFSSVNCHRDLFKMIEIINTNNGLVLSMADTKEIGPRLLDNRPNTIAMTGSTPSPNIINNKVFLLLSAGNR